MQKDFWFQNLRPTSKEILFSKGKLFKLLSYLAKRKRDFVSKRKLL
jgi:DNA-binding winged helix-turn-helix (wHTH) protein